jgi:molybdenum cofactor cytidylyltransferase
MLNQLLSWIKGDHLSNKEPKNPTSAAGLLLAAGKGSRFDQSGTENKLLAKFNGQMVIGASAAALAGAVTNRIAVIRPDSEDLRRHLSKAGYKVVECPDASSGMGHSLAWGVAEAMKAFDMQMLVVALGDMPSVKADTISQLLLAAQDSDAIVAPVNNGKRGNPVVFQSHHFEALARLSGDRGASQFMKNADVLLIEVDDPGIHQDIDSPEDLKKYQVNE